MDRTEKLNVLIVDDQVEVLDVYRDVIQHRLGHAVTCASWPAEAMRHVQERMFDLVLIDAKIPYKGAMLGGLILAEEVGRVLGMQSVMLMSQYDVRGEVAHFNPIITFLSKPPIGRNLITWVEKDLVEKIQGLVRRQYGFVAMPFGDAECDEWYRAVLAPWMKEAGYALKRMDEIATTKAINVEMLEKIRQAHFVIVGLRSFNANVYYEAGFATALSKFLLLFAQNLEALPFDIRANRVFPMAKATDGQARAELLKFLRDLRGVAR
jgi:CheY-like chemotaxis protein